MKFNLNFYQKYSNYVRVVVIFQVFFYCFRYILFYKDD